MDLSRIEALHPEHDPDRQLLVLWLEHGKANEVGVEQLEALTALCDGIERDPTITCVCTTSRRVSRRGTPIFMSGANVTERADWDDDQVKAHVVRQRTLMQRLRRLPVFTIVVPHGVTLGLGTEYVLAADFGIATQTATFALPETGLGIIPGARGTAELASVVGLAQAMRLGCTGESIDAEEARRIGLVQETCAELEGGMVRVRALAELLVRRSPTAVAAFKRACLDAAGRAEHDRIAGEAAAYERCIDSGEAAIGRRSFAEIRAGSTPAWGPRRD